MQALAPLVTTLVNALRPALAEIGALIVDNLGPSIQTLIPLLAPVIGWIVAVFASQLVNAINLIVTVVGSLLKILGGVTEFLRRIHRGLVARLVRG